MALAEARAGAQEKFITIFKGVSSVVRGLFSTIAKNSVSSVTAVMMYGAVPFLRTSRDCIDL